MGSSATTCPSRRIHPARPRGLAHQLTKLFVAVGAGRDHVLGAGRAELFSDNIKYTFIAANCEQQPFTFLEGIPQEYNPNRRAFFDGKFENLVHCEWGVTSVLSRQYNCWALSAGRSDCWINPIGPEAPPHFLSIDEGQGWGGNGNGVLEDSEIDAFYADPNNGGLTNVSTDPNDITRAQVIVLKKGAIYTHPARRKANCQCGAGKWIMFESKVGVHEAIEHVWDQLNGNEYGQPVRFYW